MNRTESDFIVLCKRRIEEKLRLENGNGSLKQRDLEYLADCIEEKSGIRLSLSTLKRLWKKDYDQTPHPSTLQALVSLLDFKDWQDFKWHEAGNTETAETVTEEAPVKKKKAFNRWLVLPLVAVVPVLLWIISFRSGEPEPSSNEISGTFSFNGNKTVAQGVPNTVIFNYDVTNMSADSFFFQQSWNNKERVKLNPDDHYYSNIYYYPGYHKAKLIANDSILTRFPVHITTNGWFPLVVYEKNQEIPTYLNKQQLVKNGSMHITRNDLEAANLPADKEFMLSYFNIRDFINTGSDNFTYETKFTCDSNARIACPGVELVFVCEAHIFFVRMMGKGCERDIAVKMGEVYRDGSNNDLSALGRNLYQWQQLKVNVTNKQATVYVNDEPVFNSSFRQDFGKIVGIVYNFAGNGAVDYARLKNGKGGLVYADEF